MIRARAGLPGEGEGPAQCRHPSIKLAPLCPDDPERGQAVGLLRDRIGLLRLGNRLLGERQRLAVLPQQHPAGGERGQDPGPQGGWMAVREQRRRLFGGVHRAQSGERAAGQHGMLERVAVHVVHHDEEAAFVLAEIYRTDDVRPRKTREQRKLALEALGHAGLVL